MSGYPINDEILLALDIDRARRAEKREARKVRKAELKARRGADVHDSRKRCGRRR
jgi:hypothetical protein